MPLDGIVINALVHEFHDKLLGGKIDKVYQPQRDELVLTIRNRGQNYRLLLSATSNSPRVHLTGQSSTNPPAPPMFCMLLRKHIAGGRMTGIEQPAFERIIKFSIESYNELGDLIVKNLIIEIMGRHSNIILVNGDGKIIDSIKHIDFHISSVRQVLPGLDYTSPPSQGKLNPLTCTEGEIAAALQQQREGLKIAKSLVNSFTGISPMIGREICARALSGSDVYTGELSVEKVNALSSQMHSIFQEIKGSHFRPVLLHDQKLKKVVDFSAILISQYDDLTVEERPSMSNTLDAFYAKRDLQDRLKQRASDLLRIVNTNLERCKKKLAIQQEKLGEVSNRDQYKIYGDLITANIYRISQGMDKIEVENFYETDQTGDGSLFGSQNREPSPVSLVSIPLDPHLTPAKNAQKYFQKYTKAKNAEKMVTQQMKLNKQEIEYLESIYETIVKAETYQELDEIREELFEQKYIKRITKAKNKKKQAAASNPKQFTSSDGIDIYVGKNNKQNDYLTLKFARNHDIWFHTKTIPGSHVIVKADHHKDIPENTLVEAAMLAAYFSKGRASSNVAIDYTAVKNVKKPSGAKPGMVIYEHYKTLYVTPEETLIRKLEKQ